MGLLQRINRPVEIMENRSTGLMTLGQIGLGSIAGVILVSVGYLFTNNLFLQVIIGDRIHHGFWIGLFTLAAFLLTYGLGVVGVAYGVKWVAQRFGQNKRNKKAKITKKKR